MNVQRRREFWRSIKKSVDTDDCIEWDIGSQWIYGRITIPKGKGLLRKNINVHRYIFWETHGWWPEEVMHICDNKACVNIDHLMGGNRQTNADMASGPRKKRTKGECLNF